MGGWTAYTFHLCTQIWHTRRKFNLSSSVIKIMTIWPEILRFMVNLFWYGCPQNPPTATPVWVNPLLTLHLTKATRYELRVVSSYGPIANNVYAFTRVFNSFRANIDDRMSWFVALKW